MSGKAADWIRLAVRYKGKCSECGKEIPQGESALWSKSSKAIKHMKCESAGQIEVRAGQDSGRTLELGCFVCGKPAGCLQCGFEADCNRAAVSQACICNQCMSESETYKKYQEAFLVKMSKLAKAKS
jgi:hypothetical protein